MNSAFRLGWRTLWRDWRAGELRLLIVAVVLAVAALTAVAFFADRLQGGLERDARQLLGGDAVLASDQPPPHSMTARAAALGLQAALTYTFPTMARSSDARGGESKLVSLKAVAQGYPLRGQLQVADLSTAQGQPTRAVPAPGQVWVDASLLESLGLRVGDSLHLGDTELVVQRVITLEPDRGAGFLNFSPRVMMNQADVPRTALVQPASRIGYRLAVAGEAGAVRSFVAEAQALIKGGQLRGARLESLESGRPEMRQTLERAEKFLNLVALLAALLSAVAVALTARGFAARHLDDCAMLRVLGQSQRTITIAYSVEFASVGLAASLLGTALGFAVHYVFVLLLAGLVDNALPPPTLWPLAFGIGMGLTLLLSFGLPPVLQLAKVPPLRVIRRDVGGLRPASAAVLVVGVLGFAALLLAASRDVWLGGIAVGGFAAAVLVFALLAWLAVKLLRRSVNEGTAPRWLVLATRQFTARPVYAVVQVSALSVGLLALMLLVLLRTDLVSSWRKATPPDAPNRFVINVLPDQATDFRAALGEAGIQQYDWYPMFRGRLVAVNGKAVSPDDYAEERAKRLVDREFNLSNAAERPPHNEIVQGRWQSGEADGLSVEEGLMDTLGLKLGDQLSFEIGGQSSQGRITSTRKVDWGSMRANFFVMYPLAAMPAEVPQTYLSAFRAPPERAGFDNALVRRFPNVTAVDMSATLSQLQRVLDQVIRAVEFLFGFALAAGVVVLFAAVTATRDERAKEFAVMRALGARASLLRQVQRAELAGVGLLAGVLAGVVASVIGWALARYVFDFSWSASAWVPLAGAVAGALLALAAGWWGLREVLQRPVMATLRQAVE